ncbi:hypothetical protein GCM10009039_24340 [Halocalculus aciditolerans]|uniref:Uncharacterized protein n=1 Tax=Halocalculus aciditolerans TaxID=1383812 RepID=A0A830FE25_9EURY|nr:hypothetical protein GCM10009039_24340 [Halocalculus aciditolerans]
MFGFARVVSAVPPVDAGVDVVPSSAVCDAPLQPATNPTPAAASASALRRRMHGITLRHTQKRLACSY